MLQLTVNGSWTQFLRPLRNHEAFKTYGNLHGHPGPAQSRGLLGWDLQDKTALADYVVYSYETPIAWHVPGSHWIMPDVRYSVTTSKAQSQIRTAISVMKDEYCSFCGCSYSGFETVPIRLCIDCRSVIECDEWSAIPEKDLADFRNRFQEGMKREIGDQNAAIVVNEGEPYFSHDSCDICRTPLAGDRFDAEILFHRG